MTVEAFNAYGTDKSPPHRKSKPCPLKTPRKEPPPPPPTAAGRPCPKTPGRSLCPPTPSRSLCQPILVGTPAILAADLIYRDIDTVKPANVEKAHAEGFTMVTVLHVSKFKGSCIFCGSTSDGRKFSNKVDDLLHRITNWET